MPPASPAGAAPVHRPATPGLKFFADLNKAGNFVPVIGKVGLAGAGLDPDHRSAGTTTRLADRDTLAGNPPIDVVVPKTGVVAGVYVQAISAFAPHPNAAKLWMEYLYSDEGQLGWLKGYCHPIRFNDLAKNGKIPPDLLASCRRPTPTPRRGVPDPRRAGRRQGSHHQAVGQRRRRQRPVVSTDHGPRSRLPRARIVAPLVSPHRGGHHRARWHEP